MAKVREIAKLINLELAEQTPNEYHANLSGKHENFRDQSIRHDWPNDASALLPACHPPEVGQEGASVVYSTNKRKDLLAMQIEDGIFDAINVLRYHSKKRPDKKSIPDYVAKKLDADKGAILQVLLSLSHAERVHVKKINGKDSYFIGKNPLSDEAHESTEAKDQSDDSFLEFLDGIKMPVKGTPSYALKIDTENADSGSTSEMDFE